MSRASWTRRPPPASSTRTTATSRSSSGGGVAAFDCEDDGRPDLYFAGGTPRPRLSQREPGRRRAAVRRRCASPTTDLAGVTGAYPLDIDGDGITRPGGPAARRERPPPRRRRLRGSSARTRPGVRRRRRMDHGIQRHVGGGGDAADPGLRQLPRARRRPAEPSRLRDGQLFRPGADGRGYAGADRAHARAGARSRCCSATGTGPAAATCACRNDRHYYARTARSSSGASSRASRRACTPPTKAGSRCEIWGMGIASYDLTGDGYPEVYLTSQGDNKLQTLADGAGAADLPRHRARAAGSRRHRPYRRRRRACRRPPGTPSSRT